MSTSEQRRYLRIGDLIKRYSVCKTTVHNWRRAGLLPQGIQRGPRVVVYDSAELDLYDARCAAQRAAA